MYSKPDMTNATDRLAHMLSEMHFRTAVCLTVSDALQLRDVLIDMLKDARTLDAA